MSGLRILSGDAKGRCLKTLAIEDLSVRPMLGRMKKSLFDILRPRLGGSDFLDLFAGSGAVGIEALSQGARFATFVDMNPNCLSVIRQNLFWAFFYNALGVPLAALGFISPVVCAAAMGLSDLIVVGNALLGDDGAGLLVLAELERDAALWAGQVEFLDGGTQGLTLLDLREVVRQPAGTELRREIEEIRTLLFGVIEARNKVLLTMNVPTGSMEALVAALPAMKKPTVSRLHGIDYYSIQTVVQKSAVNGLIPKLKQCGAEDILEIPIAKIVP